MLGVVAATPEVELADCEPVAFWSTVVVLVLGLVAAVEEAAIPLELVEPVAVVESKLLGAGVTAALFAAGAIAVVEDDGEVEL